MLYSRGIMFNKQYLIKYSIKEVSEIIKQIESALTVENISMEKILNTMLIIEELLVNIIIHNKLDDKLIEMEIVADSKEIIISMKDSGQPFDTVEYINKPKNERIRPLAEGGNGLYLVKTLSKDLEYTRKDDKNIIRLIVLDPV